MEPMPRRGVRFNMDQFALVLTAMVLCLTACAIVAQLLRWRRAHVRERERMGRAVHDDPQWRKWAGGDPERHNGG